MASTFPVEPPPTPGWWTQLQYNRLVARGRADRQAREEANELGKRLRRARRRAERIDEALVLLASSDEARRHMRQQGYSYERANRHGYVETR